MLADSLDLAYVSPWNVALPGFANHAQSATNLVYDGQSTATRTGNNAVIWIFRNLTIEIDTSIRPSESRR